MESKQITGLREKDILISPVSLPERPNIFTDVHHTKKSVFRAYDRFQRAPSSVVMSHDNVVNDANPQEDTVGVIAEIMDVVSHLFITKADAMRDTVASGLSLSLSKVTCQNLSYPEGVAYRLSQAEFVLHTHTRLGIEMMGVEGGCAAASRFIRILNFI